MLDGDRLTVVAGDQAAERDAPEGVHPRKGCIKRSPAHVLEDDVDPVPGGGLEVGLERVGLVVDASVESELARHQLAFRLPTGDADCAAAAQFRELSHNAADSAGGRRYHHRLALLRLSDLSEPVPGGDAGHAHAAKVRRSRDRPDVYFAQPGAGDLELLPAPHPADEVAWLELRVFRLDHLCDGAADHHLAEWLRRRVGLALLHP